MSDTPRLARQTVAALAVAALLSTALVPGLAAGWGAAGGRATLVVSGDALADGVADTLGALASEMEIALDRVDARDAASALAAIEASRDVVVLVGHGDADGYHVGGETIAWARLAEAIDASPAPGAILVACGSAAAAALAHKPVFGYVGEVDARVAELDAFEQLTTQLYGEQAARDGKAKQVLWGHVARAHGPAPDLLERIFEPREPLFHEPSHREPHHTTGEEKAYAVEQSAGAAGGFYFEWGQIIEGFKVGQRCSGGQCAWIVSFEAQYCKTLLSMYDLSFPGSGKVIKKISQKLTGWDAEILALKLCGGISFEVTETGVKGGGELALRLGVFIESPGRWFMTISFEIYIQAAMEWPAAKSDGRNLDITIPWHVDIAAEGRLYYLYFAVNKNLGRGDLDIRICYACFGSGDAASASGADGPRPAPATPTSLTMVPGPALANHMRATGMDRQLGIPAGVDLTQVRLDLLHPEVDRVLRADLARSTGVEIPAPSRAAAAQCPGPAVRLPNFWYPDHDGDGAADADTLAAHAGACALGDGSTSASAGLVVGDPALAAGASPTGVAWSLVHEVAGDQLQVVTDAYSTYRGSPAAGLLLEAQEAYESYAQKRALDATLVTPPIDCLFTVRHPHEPDGPAVLTGPCYGTYPPFYHMEGTEVARAGPLAADAAALAGAMVGGGVLTDPGALDLGATSGCASVFDRASC